MKTPPTGPAVLLFHGRGLLSFLVRWQTRGSHSHAALLMPDGQIVESWQGAGVRVKTLKDWDGIDVFTVPMTPEQWKLAIDFALSHVGAGYDYWGIIRFVSRRNMPDNQKWFCSELVFSALAFAGLRLFNRIDPGEVSPGLLAISPLLTPPKGEKEISDAG